MEEVDQAADEARLAIRMGLELSRMSGKPLLVNSEFRIALEEGAHGAHLKSSQELAQALSQRTALGRPEFLIGKSAHSVSEAVQAEEEGADYVFLSPIFDPISKDSEKEPLGISHLREAAQILVIPVFALGGISPQSLGQILKTGARGVAGIGWFAQEMRDAAL